MTTVQILVDELSDLFGQDNNLVVIRIQHIGSGAKPKPWAEIRSAGDDSESVRAMLDRLGNEVMRTLFPESVQ